MKTTQRKCPCCGKTFWSFTSDAKASSYNKEWEGTLCRDCTNWFNLINEKRPDMEVIDGICYDFLTPQKDIGPGDTLGGGRMKYILKKDGSVKKSNDIWKIGVVPQHLKEKLPDTAWWISRRNFRNLRYGWYECDNKGCFDRYHCMRYHIKQEDSKPYNVVPDNWQIGDEKCPIFISTSEIENYNGERIGI